MSQSNETTYLILAALGADLTSECNEIVSQVQKGASTSATCARLREILSVFEDHGIGYDGTSTMRKSELAKTVALGYEAFADRLQEEAEREAKSKARSAAAQRARQLREDLGHPSRGDNVKAADCLGTRHAENVYAASRYFDAVASSMHKTAKVYRGAETLTRQVRVVHDLVTKMVLTDEMDLDVEALRDEVEWLDLIREVMVRNLEGVSHSLDVPPTVARRAKELAKADKNDA